LLNKIHVDPDILPEIESKGERDIRIEEFFIGQILRKIAKHGIRLLPPADYRDFKSKRFLGVKNTFVFCSFKMQKYGKNEGNSFRSCQLNWNWKESLISSRKWKGSSVYSELKLNLQIG